MISSALFILLALPFIGAVLAYSSGKFNSKLPFWVAEIIGGLFFLASILIFMNYKEPIDISYTWIAYGDLNLPFGIYIDHLSVTMLLIATGLGWVDIHFAHDYMGDEPDQGRYYSKVLFFIGGMILLVTTKDLIGCRYASISLYQIWRYLYISSNCTFNVLCRNCRFRSFKSYGS